DNKIDKFYNSMEIALREDDENNIKTPNIYDHIYDLHGLYITTNADTHFDRLFDPLNIIYDPLEFTIQKIDSTNIYHIHGSIKDKESLVFTVSKYMRRYTNSKYDKFRNFLRTIFREYTVLFLGYGLAEFELLDFILEEKESKNNQHFMLSPYYQNEINILNYEQKYYNDLGINVLPYEKDNIGYRQLEKVIKKWSDEIEDVTNVLPKQANLIDEAVE
ncbi:MAG: SIR2 family protein, partial [Candidatus Marinimicrobia bacterium]|nr:SIR2 family protein [Candidatus Neomarinimicrobiota bacterium]